MIKYFKKINAALKKINIKHFFRLFILLTVLVLIFLAGVSSYYIVYQGKIYPNLSIAGVNIGGNSLENSVSILTSLISTPQEIELVYGSDTFSIEAADIGFSYDFPVSVQNVYNSTRTGNFFEDLKNRIFLLFTKKDFDLVYKINGDVLQEKIAIITEGVSTEPVEPFITVNGEDVFVNKGESGTVLDENKLLSDINRVLSKNLTPKLEIPVTIVDPTLTDGEAELFSERARKFIGKTLKIEFEYKSFSFESSELIQLLDPKENYKNSALEIFIENLVPSIERGVQNPKFTFENGRVTEFQPALDGIKIDDESFKKLLIESLDELAVSEDATINITVPVVKVPPAISTGDVNDYGIKELIGRGTSTYYHSIASRVHNVSLAASRINGILVKPGETFSFNQALGEVSGATGYQQAYIISEGRTILGDGGGVCQVSTTLFRALLDAGLPIVERQAHAYRVSYYEQDSPPGIDATVYSPSPDLKFTNDTPGYILIEAFANPKNYSLVFELYGTNDGRVSKLSKPVITNVAAPPEDLYQDDPTLPAGTIKQIDWKAWGAKVSFNYTVTRAGEEIMDKTFISNYKPWQAVYLRGTGPSNN